LFTVVNNRWVRSESFAKHLVNYGQFSVVP